MSNYYEEKRRANIMVADYVLRIKKGELITIDSIIKEVTEKHAVSEKGVRERIDLIMRHESLREIEGEIVPVDETK